MNGFDFILILVVLLTTIDVFYLKRRYGTIMLLISAVIAVIVLHIGFGNIRWQVILLYAYPFYIVIYYTLLQVDHDQFKAKLNKVYRVFVIVIILFSTTFMIVLPVKALEAPRGKYVVGTKVFNIRDKSRKEIYGDKVGENRDIRIQIWYPSDSNNNQTPEKWMIDGQAVTREYAKQFHLLSFMLDHTENIYSHSYKNLAISNKALNYPVIVVSHGWTSSKDFHLDLSERLASNGYIVVGIDHTYGAAATRLGDGQVAILDNEALPVKEAFFLEKAEVLLDVYSEDIKFVIDYLHLMNVDDPILKGKFDLEHMATFGHSTGAGAGVKAAIEDERIIAVMGMDPWLVPIQVELLEKGLSIDSLFFRSEEWATNSNNDYLKILFDHSKNIDGVLQIEGSKHVDFTMLYAYSDVAKYFGFAGKHSGYENSLLQQEFALNFFNCYLKDQTNYIEEYIKEYENLNFIELD